MSMQTSDAPRFSAWSGIIKTLTNPTAVFASLADHPKPPFFLAYILAGVLALPFTYVTINLTQSLVQQQMLTQGNSPETIAVIQATTLVTGLVVALFGPMLGGLLTSLLAMLIGLFVGGGVRLRQYYSMLAYATIPVAIGSFIQGLLSLNAGSMEDLQRVSLSLAILLPEGSNRFLFALLNTVNPFALWHLFLTTLGFAALHRIKPTKGALFSGTIYAITVLFALIGASIKLPQ